MNIWEIENRSGVSGENIGFYEKRELLFPKFDEYGCRDYSDADLETLMRIKLLRLLGISIDRIKLLHEDKTKLSAVLDERLSEPPSNVTELENQKTVCSTMKEDGAEYSELDAQRYIERLEQLSNGRLMARLIEADVVPKLRYPWRRFFARTIDTNAYSLIWFFILYVVIGTYPIKNSIVLYFSSFVVFALMIFIEPLLLSKFGTTLGKWIFGLSLTDINNRKPSYSMGLSRTWGVFAKGYGYNIPIYDLVRYYKSYKACKNAELPWDDGFVYSIRDTKAYRSFVFIAVLAVISFATYFLIQNAEMPKNRGNISAVEFAENYNDFIQYIGAYSGRYLKADGTFEDEPNTIMVFMDYPPPKFEINEENGVVTCVAFEVETADDNPITAPITQMMAATMAYVAAQPEMNCIKLRSEGILNNFKKSFQSFEFTSAGVYVSCKVEYRGYSPSPYYLIPIEGEERNYHLVFKMETVE